MPDQQSVPWNSYTHSLYQFRGPSRLRTLAPLSQPAEGTSVSTVNQLPSFHHAAAFPPSHMLGTPTLALEAPSHPAPPISTTSVRKKKAPTLRAADWEPMKTRITELWTSDEKCTILSLRETLEREFAFTAT